MIRSPRGLALARTGGWLVVIVGVCRITFGLPGNDSLKGKRRVVRRILDRTRNQFNAAVAEVGNLDEHRRASIGIAVVSNDGRHANSMLDTIAAFASSQTEAVVLDRSMELVHIGGERLEALEHSWGAEDDHESPFDAAADAADDEELES